MKYLHTMVRVTDLDASLDFYCNKLGLEEIRRIDVEAARFSLIFLAADFSKVWLFWALPVQPDTRERDPRK